MASPPLGAHVSVAGGMERSIERGAELGCEAIQIFVRNPSRWQGRPLPEEEAGRFRAARRRDTVGATFAHASYLINLAARDRTTLRRSRRALADELARCDRLGIDGLVLHPGAHLEAGEAKGIARAGASLRAVLDRRPAGGSTVLLENTAGQGSVLGYRLEHLAAVREIAGHPGRIGVCVDTCHAFAAGYPIHHDRGYEQFVAELEATLGLGSVGCLHLNDSRGELASRRDRHANLGEGEIGDALFRRLVADARFGRVPMILETPLGDDRGGHRRDLRKLRRWRRRRKKSTPTGSVPGLR